jgi:restriction endonuclease Mrr
MSDIFNNIKTNFENNILYFSKIQILFFLMFIFSLLYMLLDDEHFEGVNKFKEIVKEEVIKDKAKQEIKENYDNLKEYYNDNKIINKTKFSENNSNNIVEEKVIDEVAKETEQEVKNEELSIEKVEPNLIKKYFDRLYFAIITGCLLGYGDIFPVTYTSKTLAGIQGLLTVSLIVY